MVPGPPTLWGYLLDSPRSFLPDSDVGSPSSWPAESTTISSFARALARRRKRENPQRGAVGLPSVLTY